MNFYQTEFVLSALGETQAPKTSSVWHSNLFAESLDITRELEPYVVEEVSLAQVETKLVTSREKLDVPLSLTSQLQNTEAVAGEDVDLFCEMSQIGMEVTWLKDQEPLCMADGRYKVINQDTMYHLIVPCVTPDDSGTYTVQAGDLQSTALLTVHGERKIAKLTQILKNCVFSQTRARNVFLQTKLFLQNLKKKQRILNRRTLLKRQSLMWLKN